MPACRSAFEGAADQPFNEKEGGGRTEALPHQRAGAHEALAPGNPRGRRNW
jgi:hypothetical protein